MLILLSKNGRKIFLAAMVTGVLAMSQTTTYAFHIPTISSSARTARPLRTDASTLVRPVHAALSVRKDGKDDFSSKSHILDEEGKPGAQRRRDFFSNARRIILGAGTVATSTFGGGLPSIAPASAESVAISRSGKTIEFQVNNLAGGDATGTIKIMMKPDWAPRGVARFEVRFLLQS